MNVKRSMKIMEAPVSEACERALEGARLPNAREAKRIDADRLHILTCCNEFVSTVGIYTLARSLIAEELDPRWVPSSAASATADAAVIRGTMAKVWDYRRRNVVYPKEAPGLMLTVLPRAAARLGRYSEYPLEELFHDGGAALLNIQKQLQAQGPLIMAINFDFMGEFTVQPYLTFVIAEPVAPPIADEVVASVRALEYFEAVPEDVRAIPFDNVTAIASHISTSPHWSNLDKLAATGDRIKRRVIPHQLKGEAELLQWLAPLQYDQRFCFAE